MRKSHRTDNDRAKMATSKGVIQGDTGVAAVDAAHQIIVVAQAHGTGSEQELQVPIVEALQPMRGATTLITADRDMRQRDECFATPGRHQQNSHPLHNKSATPTTSPATVFTTADFTYDAEARTGVCPAGKSL